MDVLVVSNDTSDTAITGTFRSGARGCVVKENAPEILEMAIRSIASGGVLPSILRLQAS